jgi:hypothetical protein
VPPAAAPTAPTAAPTTPVQTAPPQTVTIPLEQLQTFTAVQARLANLEAEQRDREQKAQQDQATIMAKKGEVENALNLLRQQSEQQLANERAIRVQVEERAKRYALDGEVSRVLASQPLVPGGAEQLTQLWRNQFTVEPQGDSFRVQTPTFQSVGDFVAAQLGRPEYAHFIRAQNPGGGTAGTTGGHQAAPTPAANPIGTAPPEFKNFSEAVIYQMTQQQAARPDARLDMKAGLGLRPLAKQG